jgi:hypothetical protein
MSFSRYLVCLFLVSPVAPLCQNAVSGHVSLDSRAISSEADCESPMHIEADEWHSHLIGSQPELRIESSADFAHYNLLLLPIEIIVGCDGKVQKTKLSSFDPGALGETPETIQELQLHRQGSRGVPPDRMDWDRRQDAAPSRRLSIA